MGIELPTKVWIPKVKNIYITPYYDNDIDGVVFGFQKCGKAVYRPKKSWEEGSRTNLITFDYDKHSKELHKHIKLNSRVTTEIK